MFVTIAICTWNRASLLDRCLHQMMQLCVPEGVDWEIVVVNNNCTDHTDRVLARYASRLPLQRVQERRQGKSHALNAAVGRARGDLILWTDDDVLVDPNWLSEYVTAAREMPQAAFFGGPIRPKFENNPPAWIEEAWQYISGAFAELELGDHDLKFDERTHAFGANFAIRTSVQRKYLYDIRLGRVAENDIRCEETELQRRMMGDGHCGYWVPGARVEHIIPGDRLTHDFVRAWQVGIGESIGILKNEGSGSRRQWAWQKILLHSRLQTASFNYLIARHVIPSGHWGKYYARIGFLQGRIRRLNRIKQGWQAAKSRLGPLWPWKPAAAVGERNRSTRSAIASEVPARQHVSQ